MFLKNEIVEEMYSFPLNIIVNIGRTIEEMSTDIF